MNALTLAYGRAGLEFHPPPEAEVTVLRKAASEPSGDPAGAVRQALDHPIEAAPLIEWASGARTACVLICDITRPVPHDLLLRPLVETLLDAGVQTITLLVATGLHRQGDAAEEALLVPDPWVRERVSIAWHVATDASSHSDLGVLDSGTPVSLDTRFIAADLRIVTGLVEPHFYAGWSGGRKVIAPGVAGEQTIRTFHNHAFVADPAVTTLSLDDNPLHRDQLQIAERVGAVFAVNTVLDEQRRLLAVTAGDLNASHLAAVEIAQRSCVVSVPEPFSTVVTTAAGFPLDLTWYQAIKGLVVAQSILRPGGTLVIAAQCAEGLGSSAFVDGLRRLRTAGPPQLLSELSCQPLANPDEWQVQSLAQVLATSTVVAYTGLGASDGALTCANVTADLTASVAQWMRRQHDPRIAVIPEGPYVAPVIGAPDDL